MSEMIAPAFYVAKQEERDGERIVDWTTHHVASRELGRVDTEQYYSGSGRMFDIRRSDGVRVSVDELGMANGAQVVFGATTRRMLDAISGSDFGRAMARDEIGHIVLDAFHRGNPFRAKVLATPYTPAASPLANAQSEDSPAPSHFASEDE